MTVRSLFSILAVAMLALAAPLAAAEPPDGLAPAEWAAIQEQIEAEVDRDLIAGKAGFERGVTGNEHGLVRTAVVSGDYTGLAAQDNSDGPRFGHSVAIDGDWLAVGAPGTIWTHAEHGTADHGAVFMFRRDAGGWALQQRVLLGLTPAGGRCGHAVALRLPYVAFGCPEVDTVSGTQIMGWMFVRRLDPDTGVFEPSSSHPGGEDGRCGSAVAITQDDLAMGCPTAAAASAGGRVRMYRRNPDTGIFAPEYVITAPNALATARFGDSVALNQSFATPVRLAVGSPVRSPSPFVASGAVHVFERSTPGGTPTWTQSQFITAPTQNSLAYFGQAVALNRTQLVIGAPTDFCHVSGPNRCGRAYRYARSDGAWTFQELRSPVNIPGGVVNGPEPGMRFGDAVAIGFDSFTAIAAPRTNAPNDLIVGGSHSDVGLVEMRRLNPSEHHVNAYRGVLRPGPLSPISLAEGHFGTSIDFGGRRLAVGYPGAGSALPAPGARRGQVWIYETDAIFTDGFESPLQAATGDQP